MQEVTDLPSISPPSGQVFRVGYKPDPFIPVPWRFLRQRDLLINPVNSSVTIGGRYDDPAGRFGLAEVRRFRTIYCATNQAAAFAETIMPFRSLTSRSAGESESDRFKRLQNIIEADSDLEQVIGVVPLDFLLNRCVGKAILDPAMRFLDLAHPDTVRYIRHQLGEVADTFGIQRIDYGAVLGTNRRFTQHVAGHFYEIFDDQTDQPMFAGMRYISSLNLEWECWAIFDQRYRPTADTIKEIDPTDPEIVELAEHFDLKLGDHSPQH